MASCQPPSVPPLQWGEGYGAIVLAAGLSSRMGTRGHSPVVENKLLLPWTDGRPIICHAVAKYVDSGIDPIVIVTGRDADAVADCLADYSLGFAHNSEYASGEILSSVKVGLRSLPNALDATFIQPADMPCISSALIKQVAAQYEAGFNVAPVYKGRRGHPVLLDKAYWREMLDLPAEAMPRAVIVGAREKLRLVEVDEKGVVMDIDTREAYQRALRAGC